MDDFSEYRLIVFFLNCTSSLEMKWYHLIPKSVQRRVLILHAHALTPVTVEHSKLQGGPEKNANFNAL